MKRCVMALGFLAAGTLWGAAKLETVVEGYSVWDGVNDKNRICGRPLCTSDFRQRVTVVLELEATDQFASQLAAAAPLAGYTTLRADDGYGAANSLPRDVLFVVVNRGLKDRAIINAAFAGKPKGEAAAPDLSVFVEQDTPVYEELSFVGAPEIARRPYVYVMGPNGTEALYQGEFDEAAVGEVRRAIGKAFAQMSKRSWKPFYGYADETRFHPMIAKALDTLKPLSPIAKQVKAEAAALAKDPDKAQEMQKLYDGIYQTRSEMVRKIRLAVKKNPVEALCEIQRLGKYFPAAKKLVEAELAKVKSMPEVEKLAGLYAKVQTWSSPTFTCKNAAEAKKIVAQLTNMRKQLAKAKESKVQAVQAAALLIDGKLEELQTAIPSKVPQK